MGSDGGVRVRAPIGRWERHLRGAGAAGQVGEPSLYGPPAEQRRARMHVWCVSGVIRCVAMPAAPPHAGRRLHPDTFVAVCHRWPARGTTTIRGQDDPRTYPLKRFLRGERQTFKARLSVNPPNSRTPASSSGRLNSTTPFAACASDGDSMEFDGDSRHVPI